MRRIKSINSLSRLLFSVTLLVSTPFVIAAQSQPTQQALEQLRMLQQKLSSSNQPPSSPEGKSSVTDQLLSQQKIDANDTKLNPQTKPANESNQPDKQVDDGEKILSNADKQALDSMAFDGVTEQLFPLTPEQIIRLKQKQDTIQFAQASSPGAPPKPTATSQFVNLSPGSTPPVIRLSQGFVSSLVFLDSTGAPWPINAYDLGDPSAFNIQWDKTSNTLMIQATKLYTYGNLAVRLKNLNTPVMLTLIPGQKAVDYRVDLRVQGYGPNAKSMPLEEGTPPSANDLLLNVLDGVPPPGSSRLSISGGDARAWLLNEKMYVRTDLTILSPGWISSMTSADGMHAYEMQKSPILLVSWHGKVMQLKVEGL